MSDLRHYVRFPKISRIFFIFTACRLDSQNDQIFVRFITRLERLKVWNYSLVSSEMSVRSCKLVGIKKGDKMSANVYTIESLLVGKPYYSRTLQGEIISAEKHPHAVWYENCESYLVEIRPTHGYKNAWRTLAVKVSD